MTATLLVVDDIDLNIKLLSDKLTNKYYNVIQAHNGSIALSILHEKKIDVALIDYMMPEMDGLQVCRNIKNNPITTYIPVIMITAHSDFERKLLCLEAGADDFLTKPINDIALFTRLKSLTRVKRLIDELSLRNQTNLELGALQIQISDTTNSKILILDDDEVQAKNITTIISGITNFIKYIDVSTPNYFNEIKISPDIILINSSINEDPLKLFSILKNFELTKSAIFILISEEEDNKIISTGIDLGVDDYIIYPADTNELIARIKTHLRRKSYYDSLKNEITATINLSIKDYLTGLFNKRYFESHLIKILNSENISTYVALIDIDFFKTINDTYGHIVGDSIIVQVANTILQSVKITDLAARYGGDEFIVILQNISMSEAHSVCDRMLNNIKSIHLKSENYDIHVTISLGIAEYKKSTKLWDFINQADKALYRAKKSGKNQFCIYNTNIDF